MLESWAGFKEFLREQGCEPVDESDWGFPIWRSRAGRFAGLDEAKPLDDFMICAICDALYIEPPIHHNGVIPIVKDIKERGFKNQREE